jgi:hypothetical protein
MLTKKQLWRRTKSIHRNRSYCRNELQNEITAIHDLQNEPLHHQQPHPPVKLKSALSSGNLTKLKNSNPRILRFSSTVHVLLIPSRFEILSHCINVYYLTEDFISFKKEAIQEIREIAKQYNLTVKIAMNYLYQPNYILPRTESSISLVDHLSSPTSSSSSPSSSSPSSPISTHEELLTQQQQGREQGRSQGVRPGKGKQGMNHLEFVKTSKFLESELKFFVNVKTDVELQDQNTSRGIVKRPAGSSLPPLKQHAWVVQWKKQSNIPAGNTPTTTSLSVGSFQPPPAFSQ